MNIIENFKKNNYLTNIIYINTILFVLITFFSIILPKLYNLQPNNEIISYLAIPANTSLLIKRPWTIITHMFIHIDILHLLINLCYLYLGGKIFTTYLIQKKLLSTYLMGGITGAIIYILALNIFPVFDVEKNHLGIGASASALAILVASTAHVPNFSVNILIGNVRLKYIAIIAIIISILSLDKDIANAGGHIAHLGGALYGYLYIYLGKLNINTNYIIDQLISFLLKNKKKILRRKNENDYEYNARKIKEQKKIDDILEKISRSGYDSLSNEEKEELFKQK